MLEREGLAMAMVLQVHDELLFDLPESAARALKEEIKEIMESAADLAVPLEVEMKTGGDWYAMEDG